ncbi:CCA tRNA nucleotidyltransferase [Niallia sp. XMNu-256]|uniref:CCA tRNA nucleotidyltransferase n=1 Tax=Niallia sp. XMNu-256 TaxID=3082444 RepID=UPI0030CBA56F
MLPVFTQAIPILTKIEKAGYEAYFVGGCVRDYLLGRVISDIDIATSATPSEIKQIFPRTVDVGIEHGTVVVLWNNETYELTTFRTDGEYIDFRRPSEVTFIRNLHDDLKRRDFTMNSIAMDKGGTFTDPFCGKQAIRSKVIETVGSPRERFHEDALRMMRAVRFVSQLQFSVEQNTYHALREHAPLLENVATERKTVEFEKLLIGKGKEQALQILIDTSLYKYLPGLKGKQPALEQMVKLNIEPLAIDEMWTLLLYLLGTTIDHPETFLRQWKLPVKKIKKVTLLLQLLHHRLQQKWTVETLFDAKLENAIHTEKIYNILQQHDVLKGIMDLKKQHSLLPIKERQDLAVRGDDLMKWYDKDGGPWIKEVLQIIERAVITGKIENEKVQIREWLTKCNLK